MRTEEENNIVVGGPENEHLLMHTYVCMSSLGLSLELVMVSYNELKK